MFTYDTYRLYLPISTLSCNLFAVFCNISWNLILIWSKIDFCSLIDSSFFWISSLFFLANSATSIFFCFMNISSSSINFSNLATWSIYSLTLFFKLSFARLIFCDSSNVSVSIAFCSSVCRKRIFSSSLFALISFSCSKNIKFSNFSNSRARSSLIFLSSSPSLSFPFLASVGVVLNFEFAFQSEIL